MRLHRFLDNGGVAGGYVLKPSILRDPAVPFDAVAGLPVESTAYHLTVKVRLPLSSAFHVF